MFRVLGRENRRENPGFPPFWLIFPCSLIYRVFRRSFFLLCREKSFLGSCRPSHPEVPISRSSPVHSFSGLQSRCSDKKVWHAILQQVMSLSLPQMRRRPSPAQVLVSPGGPEPSQKVCRRWKSSEVSGVAVTNSVFYFESSGLRPSHLNMETQREQQTHSKVSVSWRLCVMWT